MEHECVYGVTLGGHEITETLLSGNIDFPKYRKGETLIIGTMTDYLDRRKNLATHYEFCPYCGEKLDRKKIKEVAKAVDDYFGANIEIYKNRRD